jgi:IrrE N-terminal-like domain
LGKKEMKLPTTAAGWAIHLSQIVKHVHEAHGLDRFPIKVAEIAREYSAQVYSNAPITLIEGRALGKKFEGALVPKPDQSGEWGIIYNSSIASTGRINFTLGHELGHYLLHRQLSGEPMFCAKSDMWEWDSAYGQMEAQANEFASFLLMPLDDFRSQLSGLSRPSLNDFEFLRLRYDVSLTAVILK